MDVRQPTTDTRRAPHATAWLRSWLPAGPTARVRAVLAGVLLASGVTTVAVAQPPTAPRRAATLLPPQPLGPEDRLPVARGAIDDTPAFPLASTPVTRTGRKPSGSGEPAWLTGVDPNVIPASGALPAKSAPPPVTTAAVKSARLTPPPPLHIPAREAAKGVAGSERTTWTSANEPDAGTPLRGTAANGAPVLAGPPAYRWYGYGTVTPGANPYAPNGQYPRASANWYSTTGATPGAFPVPVVNPYRAAPGSEPPTYATGPVSRPPVVTAPPEKVIVREPAVAPVSSPAAVTVHPTTGTPALPAPNLQSPAPVARPPRPAVPSPTASPLSQPMPLPATGPTPTAPLPPAGAGLGAKSPPPSVGTPALVPPPAMTPTAARSVPAAKPVGPVVTVPPPASPTPAPEAKRPIPGLVPAAGSSIATTRPPVQGSSATPAPLPGTVADGVQWQPTPEKALPVLPGTWVPAASPRGPVVPSVEPGAANTALKSIVARAQVPDRDRQPDPAATLIHSMCRGRASEVDVRWTGSNRLAVCFEARGEPGARQLVTDICARPELGPLQIDFCVVVK